jgi:hypothetical protein
MGMAPGSDSVVERFSEYFSALRRKAPDLLEKGGINL